MDEKPIKVVVERDLESLIPGFLQRRRDDVDKLRSALEAQDFDAIRIIGHSMKGTGGGYGFDGLSGIGAAIETGAKSANMQIVGEEVTNLEHYLDCLQVEFE